MPDLAVDHQVITVDLRGHGASAPGVVYDPVSLASDVHAAVSAPGVESPVLVGHSLDGVVVSSYAAVFGCRAVVNVDQPLRLAAFKAQLAESLLRGDESTFRGSSTPCSR